MPDELTPAAPPPPPTGVAGTSAYRALIWLSVKRQARARQMVWIALGLLVVALAGVAIQTARGRWGMDHWRWPRGTGPTFLEWSVRFPITFGAVDHTPQGHAINHAVWGATRVILSPDGQTTSGELLACSGFQVFSTSFVFSIFLSFLLPMWSLAFGTEALGGDRESQSLIWLLSRPLSRPLVYLSKFVALLPWALGLNVGGFALLCYAAGPPGLMALRLYWPAVVLATLAFAALFLLLGAYFRRPAIVALVYSFCLEVVLGNMPGYLKRLSIGYYARCLMYERAEEYGIQPENPGVFLPVDGWTAAGVLVGLTTLLVVVGMLVFARTEYHEVD